jgi:hypothetical protein
MKRFVSDVLIISRVTVYKKAFESTEALRFLTFLFAQNVSELNWVLKQWSCGVALRPT